MNRSSEHFDSIPSRDLPTGQAGRKDLPFLRSRDPYGQSRQGAVILAARGFTVVELLVVVFILMILVTMLVPAGWTVRKNIRSSTTLATLHLLATACEQYKSDFRIYPESAHVTNFYTGLAADGRNRLVEALTGYLPAGTGSSNGDGQESWGFKVAAYDSTNSAFRGKVYGPYNGAENVTTNGTNSGVKAFMDSFENEIYYYRYDGARGDNDKYDHDDNDTATSKTGPADINLYSRIGAADNDYYDTNFILISKGADGKWYKPDFSASDDNSKYSPDCDDLANFTRR